MIIHYATRAAIPYPSAACLNTVQMCQSLAQLGHEVTLLIGRKWWRRPALLDWRTFFGFQPLFRVRRILEFPRSGLWFDAKITQLARDGQSLVYLRYVRLLPWLRRHEVPAILELHSSLSSAERQTVAQSLSDGHLRGIVVITEALRQHLLRTEELAAYADRFLVASDAVDPARFEQTADHLPLETAGYIGSLYPGKGMELLVQIARLLPQLPMEVFGGNRRQRRSWQRTTCSLPNLHLRGAVSPAAVPGCLQQIGLALLPNQPSVRLPNGDDIGSFTSPMKLFEYMAAGRVIIASDLPAIREVVTHGRNGWLVPAHSGSAWADAIVYLQQTPSLAARLSQTAREDAVHRYSYDARFRRILSHFAPDSLAGRSFAP